MKLFDFHCDTPFEMDKTAQALTSNNCHISLEKAGTYETYGQVMAIWTQRSLPEETAWERFFAIRENFFSKMTEKTALCHTYAEMDAAFARGQHGFILAVEGAGLLNGKIDRVNTLYENDVRFLTLVWKGEDCIGGAFDTDAGLTDFGKEVVSRCFELGIVPDISHASDKMSETVLKMAHDAKKPVIATHSNSRAVYAHPRNLPDEYAKEIASLGGTVGVSMCPIHLAEMGVSIETVCRHMIHYMDIGISDAIAFGCDFDGIPYAPEGIEHIGDLVKIGDMLTGHGISEEMVEKIFFDNAMAFLKNTF